MSNKNNDNDPSENTLDNTLEYSTPFQYPEEDEPEKCFDVTVQQALVRFSTILFASKKPKLTLAVLLYASGVDVGMTLGCENTATEIARVLGESKQNFSWAMNKIKKEFQVKGNTGKNPSTHSNYKDNNFRPKRGTD